jgi:hypothetical protein
MEESFSLKINQTCRKFIKRCYSLKAPTNMLLVELLGNFGITEIQDFKKYIPTAKNTFKIAFEDYAYISGAIDDDIIYFTIPKQNEALIKEFEEILILWFEKQKSLKDCFQ